MRDNNAIFTTRDRKELRVVFDPDGKAFFCGADLAAIAGYESPRKAVTGGNKGVNQIDSVLRKVPWDNGMKRGRCDYTCFSAENAAKFLARRPAPYEAIRWFEDEVIPKTEQMGEEVARGYIEWSGKKQEQEEQKEEAKSEWEQEPQTRKEAHREKSSAVSISERLDAIILECALLKRELRQAR